RSRLVIDAILGQTRSGRFLRRQGMVGPRLGRRARGGIDATVWRGGPAGANDPGRILLNERGVASMMIHANDRPGIAGVCLLVLLGGTLDVPAQTDAGPAAGARSRRGQAQAQAGPDPIRYRVNYRPSDQDAWQLYAETRSLDKANTIAAEVTG